MSLLLKTQQMLAKAPRHITLARIATETQIQYTWLWSFANNKIHDPGIRRVEVLYEYLTNMPTSKAVKFDFQQLAAGFRSETEAGVYEIMTAGGDHIYIGQTNNLSRRMSEHMRNAEIMAHEPTYVRFTPVSGKKSRSWLEFVLIRAYSTYINVNFNKTRDNEYD